MKLVSNIGESLRSALDSADTDAKFTVLSSYPWSNVVNQPN